MIEDATVNLAPLLNWVIYITLFLLTNFLLRRLIKVTFGRRVIRIAKSEVLRVMSEHYKEYKFDEVNLLESKMSGVNKLLKERFGLVRGPISWSNYDIKNEYGNYDTIYEHFKLNYLEAHKKFWFYRMKYKKYHKYNERIAYKGSVIESRENKIDNLLD